MKILRKGIAIKTDAFLIPVHKIGRIPISIFVVK